MTPVQTLAGKQVVVAVTGSIAAVEAVKLIHALRRRGAEVQVVMSVAAAGIVTPDALTYASGRQAITRISASTNSCSSGRVRVVEPQVELAAEVERDAVVDPDRLGVADVQVGVRLGWKAGVDAVEPARRKVILHRLADEVGRISRRPR